MWNKDAEQLAKEQGFETADEYFQYIVDSGTNGQPQQLKNLFAVMTKNDREYFVRDWLDLRNVEHSRALRVIHTFLWD